MLFVPCNNSKALDLKSSLSEMLDSEYQLMKDNLAMRDCHEFTKALLNITIMVSGCPKSKKLLDTKIQTDFKDLVSDF